MAHIFVHYVVGDLTVGKPELVEFCEADPVEDAARAIANSPDGSITVWRRRPSPQAAPMAERFVGMLNSLDVVAFLARAGPDHDKAMRTPVAEIVVPNPNLLKEVDPGTRLIDALDMLKQGTRRLLVRKNVAWKGVSKRFSFLYHGKWLKNMESSSTGGANKSPLSSSSHFIDKFCCLSREDVVRFLIGCLGALAPIPLSPINSLGALSSNYAHIEASSPALEVADNIPHDPCAIAVIEKNSDGSHKIIGEISAYKLWKCDYLAAAWAMRNLSAGQFVIGADDNGTGEISLPDIPISPTDDARSGASSRSKKFSSRSIGFFSNHMSQMSVMRLRSMYRGRSVPLTCNHTSTLAAVMAQMLSHRATHVWATDADSEDNALVGVVSYVDVLNAVTK